MVKVNDIIQVDGYDDKWDGCIMFVDEVCDGYILAGMYVPYKGVTFLRLEDNEYYVVAKGVVWLS